VRVPAPLQTPIPLRPQSVPNTLVSCVSFGCSIDVLRKPQTVCMTTSPGPSGNIFQPALCAMQFRSRLIVTCLSDGPKVRSGGHKQTLIECSGMVLVWMPSTASVSFLPILGNGAASEVSYLSIKEASLSFGNTGQPRWPRPRPLRDFRRNPIKERLGRQTNTNRAANSG